MNLDRIVAATLIVNFVWVLPQIYAGTFAPLYGYSTAYGLLVSGVCACIVLFCLYAIWRVLTDWRAVARLYIAGFVACVLMGALWKYGFLNTHDFHKLVYVALAYTSIPIGLADAVVAAFLVSRVVFDRGKARA